MAAEEDTDVFEITDFTTSSEWERFIAKFEEILHDWRLNNSYGNASQRVNFYTDFNRYKSWSRTGTDDADKPEEKKEEIMFGKYQFIVTYHSQPLPDYGSFPKRNPNEENEKENNGALQHMMKPECDFPSKAHCISRWYGVQEFLILAPVSDEVDTETRIKLLLSSVSIAVNNCACSVPVFVQIMQTWRRMYAGVCMYPELTTNFEMVHLKSTPTQFNHLAGLLNLFKSKLGVLNFPPVSVSVRFTYVLQDWPLDSWMQNPPDMSDIINDSVDCRSLGKLPYGTSEDPVSELHLSCTWPCLSEDVIIENQTYSDLHPVHAPHWSVRVLMRDSPHCLLYDCISNFLTVCNRKETTEQLLGDIINVDRETGADITLALRNLTEPSLSYQIPSLSSVVTSARSRLKIKSDQAPLSEDMLNAIMTFLFPDATNPAAGDGSGQMNAPSSSQHDHPAAGDGTGQMNGPNTGHQDRKNFRFINTGNVSEECLNILKESEKQLKAASLDSLTTRLAVCLCVVNHKYGGLRAVAHVWQEFVLEMRYRWDNQIFVADLERGVPNLGSCLLNQKLQMLNCCIEHRKKREDNENKQSASELQNLDVREGEGEIAGSDSDSEFFECHSSAESEEYHGDGNEGRACNSVTPSATFPSSAPTSAAEGRLCQLDQKMLLKRSDYLYVPITQEPLPMTEDMLEQHSEILARLGTSNEGALLRAKMQSACLLSDMESFKAANPGCILEDFVRWYSPRDWIEDSSGESDGTIDGHLSHRMLIEGNVWVEVWKAARAVPARRQKRLFDDTVEAEKVLHLLSSLPIAQVVQHLLPALFFAAYQTIVLNETDDLHKLKQLHQQILSRLTKATLAPDQESHIYTEILNLLQLAEVVSSRAESLRIKFSDKHTNEDEKAELKHFVTELLQNVEVPVRGGPMGPTGSLIHNMFSSAYKMANMIIDDDDVSQEKRSNVKYFPKPVAREYILRTQARRLAPYSRPSPQRMYCVLMDSELRLACAFSHDTTFM